MRARLVLAAVAVAMAAYSARSATSDSGFSSAGETHHGIVLLVSAGLALVLAGLLPLGRRPSGLVGLLLVLCGISWLVTEWDNPEIGWSVAFTVGLVTFAVGPAVVTHLVLAWPSGGLRSSWEALVVASGYAVTLVLVGLLPTLLFSPRTNGCLDCPDNLVLVSDDPTRAASLGTVGIETAFGWLVVAVLVIASRAFQGGRGRVRALGVVIGPGWVYLVATAAVFWSSVGQPYLGETDLDRRLWIVQGVALAAVAAGAAWRAISTRLAERELARMVVSLDQTTAGGMQDALCRMLGDPDLTIAYPIANGEYVDASGAHVDVLGSDLCQRTALRSGGRQLALVTHRPGPLDDRGLVEEVVSMTRLGLEHERLRAENRWRLAELAASRARIVDAGQQERQRLVRDLHDGAQQQLIGLMLEIGLQGGSNSAEDACLTEAAGHLRLALDELRELAREIHPPALREEGLLAAVEDLAESLPIQLRATSGGRFPEDVEYAAYRMVTAFAAAGPCSVGLTSTSDVLTVEITLEHGEPLPVIAAVRDRVQAVGGSLSIDRSPERTRIMGRFLFPAEAGHAPPRPESIQNQGTALM